MRRLSTLLLTALLAAGLACTKPEQPGGNEPATPAEKLDEPGAAPAKPADELPSGAELLAAHVEASGGADAIAKFESIHMTGTLAVESHNLRGDMQLWWQRDGKVYVEQNIEGIGKTRFGYDGEVMWLEEPITGLRKLDGKESAAYIQSSLMFLGHEWSKHFSAANTLGKQAYAGGEVWEIELVSSSGPNVTIALDSETKRIRYIKSMQPSPLGEMPFEVRSDRYEKVEGYEFPMHKVNALSKLLELDETVTKIDVNVPVDQAMFAFPSKREVVVVDPNAQPPVEPPSQL